eukprot:361168-Chlamydomonas_euryale.AAC.4
MQHQMQHQMFKASWALAAKHAKAFVQNSNHISCKPAADIARQMFGLFTCQLRQAFARRTGSKSPPCRLPGELHGLFKCC